MAAAEAKKGRLKASLEWRIPDFAAVLGAQKEGEHPSIQSQEVASQQAPEVCWRLNLKPNGVDAKSNGQVGLFFKLCGPFPGSTAAEKDALFNGQARLGANRLAYKLSEDSKLGNAFKGWGCAKILSHIETLAALEPDGSLMVRAEWSWPGVAHEPSPKPPLSTLRSFLTSPNFSDVTIKVGDKAFPAHRLVLAGHSPVFAAMLGHEATAESQLREVAVADTTEAAMHTLLAHVYTGSAQLDDQHCPDVLALAEKYGVEALKWECETWLMRQLCAANLCDLARLADTHDAKRLFQACQDTMAQGKEKIPAAEMCRLKAEAPAVLCRLAWPFLPIQEEPTREPPAKRQRTDEEGPA